MAEAKRCMSCGMCMDCETCWMYCSTNAFVKLPKGEHYKIKTRSMQRMRQVRRVVSLRLYRE